MTLEFLTKPQPRRRHEGLTFRISQTSRSVAQLTFNAAAADLLRERGYTSVELAKDRWDNFYLLFDKEFKESSSYSLYDSKTRNPNSTAKSQQNKVAARGSEIGSRIVDRYKESLFLIEELEQGQFKMLPKLKNIQCN